MPSSTSSFETYELSRIIPQHHWAKLALLTGLITLIICISWEAYCRHLGYAPTLNDTADLWASRRAVVHQNPSRTVLIGSSRMLFDFDMDVDVDVDFDWDTDEHGDWHFDLDIDVDVEDAEDGWKDSVEAVGGKSVYRQRRAAV